MLKKLLAAVPVLLALVALPKGASAEDQRDFTVYNSLPPGWTIDELYCSPNDRARWGNDILGQDVLQPGDNVHVRFHGAYQGECIFDMKVILTNHQSYQVEDINLCNISKFNLYESNGSVRFKAR